MKSVFLALLALSLSQIFVASAQANDVSPAVDCAVTPYVGVCGNAN